MHPITIRDACLEDLPTILKIYTPEVTGQAHNYELTAPDLAEMTRRFEALKTLGMPYIVAEKDHKIMGYAYAGQYRARPAYRFTVESSIYIDQNAQRQGLGTLLMRALITQCEAKGFRLMVAVLGDAPNNLDSLALHLKLGFTDMGIMPATGFKHGDWRDTRTMWLKLGEGAETPPDETSFAYRLGMSEK